VEFLRGGDAHADAAGDGALGLAPLPDAAAVFVDQLADGHAQRQLVGAGPLDVAADVVQLRAVAAALRPGRVRRRHAHRLEPLDAAVDDVDDVGQRLGVVDDGRLAEGALDGGEGRLDTRPGAFAFQALDQAGLLAADVGAGAAVDEGIDVEAVLAEDLVAEV